MEDLYSDTVDFQTNYDESLEEPCLLPARFPNFLVNGANGIAVGMATNVPPHNLGEVVDACVILLDNPDASIEDILPVLRGPDFPTGGLIIGRAGILNAFRTGRGSIMIRAKTKVESFKKEREAIIVTELPFQVNKAKLVEKIADLVNEKVVEGISDLRDESDREGVRIVIELKKDANPDVVLNQLYRNCQLQVSFGVNMLALHNGRPKLMNLLDVLKAFLEFRSEVVVRRVRYELAKARDRAHILIGLSIAVANIDTVIAIIKSSDSPATAKAELMRMAWPAEDIEPLIRLVDDPNSIYSEGKCFLTDIQAQAILDLKLHRLTGLERTKLSDELAALSDKINDLLAILASKARVIEIIRNELLEVKENFASPRLTDFIENAEELNDEDFIQREDMVVTVSNSGYIKRVPLNSYRAQKRGGKGKTGMTTKDEDFVHDVFIANTHTTMLFFSTAGIVYMTKVYKLPLATPQSRGKALVNLLSIQDSEALSTVLALPEDESTWENYDVIFATSCGTIRRNKLSDFSYINSKGKIAMKLEEGDRLIAVMLCREDQDVLISTRYGKCVRFPVSDVRVFNSRSSMGVRAIKLLGDDEVISMAILNNAPFTVEEREEYLRYSNWLRRSGEEMISDQSMTPPEKYEEMRAVEQFFLTVTENGFAKRTSSFEYRTSSRAIQGVRNMEINSKNGNVVSVFPVEEEDDIMLVTDGGKLIRCPVKDIRICGRVTQGVILFRVGKGEKVTSAARLADNG